MLPSFSRSWMNVVLCTLALGTSGAAKADTYPTRPITLVVSFEPGGFTPAYSTPAQMSERIAQGKARYARIVKERGIHVE